MARGTVYLVGAGPGAPDLLTVRAARLLAHADVVFHDALVHPDTLALATRAKIIAVGKRSGDMRAAGPSQGSNCTPSGGSAAREPDGPPRGRTPEGEARGSFNRPQAWGGHPSTAQRFINKRLVDAARRHAVVVRLKGGDPMLFGRAQEEIAALEVAGVHYEIVPGVTSALAAAAHLRTSLTVRGSVRTFTFVTPRAADAAAAHGWVAALRHADAGAIYMGLREAPAIAQALIESGSARTTPVAIVADASLPTARLRHTTLAELAADAEWADSAPALVLIGPQFRKRTSRPREAQPAEAARCA